jgi:PPOX class probable F420-dependent enzyme
VLRIDDKELLAFWAERHLCTLTTLRADGRPHVVPVGATLDPEAGLARIIAGRTSLKVRHVAAFGDAGAPVALCQVDGRRWSTIEGTATIGSSFDEVDEACRRYAERYREPRPNPERIVILIGVDRIVGNV